MTVKVGINGFGRIGRNFFRAMLEQGVYLPPSVFEAWFLSAAHDETAMQRIIDALPKAAEAAAQAQPVQG